MPPQCVTASVVIEWYNLTYAEMDRAARMLVEVRSQAASLRASGSVRLAEPLDLVITFGCDRQTAQQVQLLLGNLINPDDSIAPRLIPVPTSDYCKMKNAGAADSKGEIIIFLDSDCIPEPHWLSSILRTFANPDISVVVGNTYVDLQQGGTYAKSMALTWMFPLRNPSDSVTLASCFYANNVAFRRDVFLSRQFPEVPGLTHAPARLLLEGLQRDGVATWHVGSARASHPPPNGPIHFFKRAISSGRARAFSEPVRNLRVMMRWIGDDIGSITWSSKRMIFSGFRVGLRWWEIPPAIAIAAAYCMLEDWGSLLSFAFPRMMRDRFRL